MMFIPPSTIVPARRCSRLFPPLGEVPQETRHLNLRWSVADADLIAKMAQQRMTDLEICAWFKRNLNLDVSREEVASLVGSFIRVDARSKL
jgi:hypothetical protein